MALGTPGTTPNSTLDANAFSKCAGSLRTNIRQCGTVTQMNAAPMTVTDLSVFQKSTDFRVMDALFRHDLEIRMCESVQNGLYDFFMAQKVNLSKKLRVSELSPGRFEIAPFVKARQYSPINDEYWYASGGVATSGAAQDGDVVTNGTVVGSEFRVDVVSTTNIPIDLNYFPVGMRVFMLGKSDAGSATRTAWKVTGNLLSGTSARLYLDAENANSNLLAYLSDKLAYPTTALLTRGTPNVNDFEKWCVESPTVLNWKMVPFWTETTRWSMCWSSLYEKWRAQVLSNGLFQEFFDLEETQKNKQLGRDWQKRFVQQMFYGKPLAYQNLSEYDSLEEIEAFDGSLLGEVANSGLVTELGADGGAVVARRANAVGIYEQLAECNRIVDLQGIYALNLPNLFTELYNMMRVREGNGHANPKAFDIFTDSVTAELINQAMLLYYKAKSQDMLQININGEGAAYKKAEFGFLYRTYQLFWPPGVTINVITHFFFDDLRAAGVANLAADDSTTRVLWVLDFTGIYPAILASNRKVHNTGDLSKLASISPDFACVMATNTKRQTLTSTMWTMIVECPASNLIVENFTSAVPEYETAAGPDYPVATSTTSSTTLAD